MSWCSVAAGMSACRSAWRSPSGPAGRDLRHQPGHPRAHRRRRDAVHGDGRRGAAPELLPTGRLGFGSDGSMIERTSHLVVVIGTPVDEFLGPSMTVFEKAVDQIAPHLRDGALVVLRSTVYPGTTGVCDPEPRRARLQRRRRVLPGADRRGPRARGARLAAADHRRGLDRRCRARGGALRRPGREDDPRLDQGSRARQAVHEHLAVHEVRGRQPVPDDRRPGRRGLHERAAGHPRGLPARRRPARARGSRPARACSRTRCSSRRSPRTTSRSDRPPCRSTRACRPTSSRAWNAATAGCRARPSASSGWPSRASRTTRAHRSATSCASSCRGPAPASCATDPYVDDDRLVPLDRVLAESDILVLGAPHKAYRGLEVGGKDVIDVWGLLGEGIRL